MRKPQILSLVLSVLTVALLLMIVSRNKALQQSKPNFAAEATYRVSFNYYLQDFDKGKRVKWYLPQTNTRQFIDSLRLPGCASQQKDFYGQRSLWQADSILEYKQLQTSFVFQGKSASYSIPEHFAIDSHIEQEYLAQTDLIQTNAPEIKAMATEILNGNSTDASRIKTAFNRVMQIPSAPIITKTDALTALSRNYASCNGKSRLFVALARAMGYPARLKGGLILETAQKRTSHVWTEIKVGDLWIPFDTLNGHFAYIPANYLEIHQGDKAMLSHSSGISYSHLVLCGYCAG